jgi:hypothetical protein
LHQKISLAFIKLHRHKDPYMYKYMMEPPAKMPTLENVEQ